MNGVRRRFQGRFCLTVLTLLVLCTGLPGHAIPSKQREIRVLFVGNSYTYFNNLPEMFAKLAETGHQAKVVTRMEAPGGWRLNHPSNGKYRSPGPASTGRGGNEAVRAPGRGAQRVSRFVTLYVI